MRQILIKQGAHAGIEWPHILNEAIGNINLADWYIEENGQGFGYALGEVPEDVTDPRPEDFTISATEEDRTEERDGETVTVHRIVRTATFNRDTYDARMTEDQS